MAHSLCLMAQAVCGDKIDGQPKIAIAKDVMTTLVNELPDEVDTGLIVYGHRSKGDCADIEVMSNLGPGNKDKMVQQIETINPKGKTPITASLNKAAEQLKIREDNVNLILVSDGKETCDADPCATAEELKAQGINVTVHVVGFDVGDEEKQQLSCIAKAGGGKYFTAKNANELKTAFTEVKQEIVKEEVVEPEPEPLTEIGLKLKTVLMEGGEPIDHKLSYEVYETEKDIQGKRKRVTYSYDNQPVFKLAAGSYFITVKHGEAFASTEVEIGEEPVKEVTLVLNAGYLRLNSIASEGGQAIDEKLSYEVYGVEKDIHGKRKRYSYSYDHTPLFYLPAGNFWVTVKHGQAVTAAEVEVKPGELTEQTLNLNVGYLRINSVISEGGEAITDKLSYEVYEMATDLQGNRKRVTYSYDASPLFRLTQGNYWVTVKHGSAFTAQEASTTAGSLTEATMKSQCRLCVN